MPVPASAVQSTNGVPPGAVPDSVNVASAEWPLLNSVIVVLPLVSVALATEENATVSASICWTTVGVALLAMKSMLATVAPPPLNELNAVLLCRSSVETPAGLALKVAEPPDATDPFQLEGRSGRCAGLKSHGSGYVALNVEFAAAAVDDAGAGD